MSLLKKAVGVAVAVAAGASLLAVAPPASAVPYPAGTVVIAAGGSDTTQNMMGSILPFYDGKTIGGKVVRTYNIPAFPTSPFAVRGDTTGCSIDVNWVQTGGTGLNTATQNAPSGSGSGKVYQVNQQSANAGNKGCIDISRSSAAPGSLTANPTQEKASFEYYAYALDAQSWATSSFKAPATLTRAQVQDIYKCNITNWDQVGGTTGPIQRYMAQSGSGTYAAFIAAYGITAADLAVTNANCPATKQDSVVDPNNPSGPLVKFEENQGNLIAPADYDKAILPYSGGPWTFQAANAINPSLDVRNGVRMGGLTTNPASGTPVKGNVIEWEPNNRQYQLNTTGADAVVVENNVTQANPSFDLTRDFVGIRYVYNIIDNTQPDYATSFALVGFSNTAGGTKSDLCSNNGGTAGQGFVNAAILSAGFATLPATGNPRNSNLAGSTCRRWSPNP